MVSRLLRVACVLGLCLAPAAQAAEVTVLDVTGDVELSPGGDDSQAFTLKGGETVKESDRIVTAMDSQARLKFGDNSVVIVGELTDMKVASFSDAGNLVHTRLWLRGGQVAATVNKESERPSDFAVKTPTATAGVRGTTLLASDMGGQFRSSVMDGQGYGENMFSTRSYIEDGQRIAQDDDDMDFDDHFDVLSDESRTDASSLDKAPSEEEAFDESEVQYVQGPGLFNAAGLGSQDPFVQEISQDPTSQQIAMGVARANIVQDSTFTTIGPGGGSPWADFSNGGTASITGGPGGCLVLGTNDPISIPNPTEVAAVKQLINFPSAGTYSFSLDVLSLSTLGGSSHNVKVVFLDSLAAGPGTATFASSSSNSISSPVPGGVSFPPFPPGVTPLTDSVTVGGPVSEFLVLEFERTDSGGTGASTLVIDNVTLTGP